MTVNINKPQINLREQLKKLERPTTDKLAVKGSNGELLQPLAGELSLSKLDATVISSATAIFVYDTSLDSDGGAWRKRTEHTSWYNEDLNQADRGSRKEFPSVAVLVAGNRYVRIYDADDPNLPMWMIFETNNAALFTIPNTISAINGMVYVGVPTYGLIRYDLIGDAIGRWRSSVGFEGYKSPDRTIAARKSSYSNTIDGAPFTGHHLPHDDINDIALKIVPNSPLDPASGLPLPTIAAATGKGSCVIKTNGHIVGFNDTAAASRPAQSLVWRGDDVVHWNINNGTLQQFFDAAHWSADDYGSQVKYNYTTNGGHGTCENVSPLLRDSGDGPFKIAAKDSKSIFAGAQSGMSAFVDGEDRGFAASTRTIFDSRVAYITSSYNTGWQLGDIQGTFLTETGRGGLIGERVDLTNGSTTGAGSTGNFSSITSNQLVAGSTNDTIGRYNTGTTLVTGKKYFAILTISNYSGSDTLGVSSGGGFSASFRYSANGTYTTTITGDAAQEIQIFYRSTNSATIKLNILDTVPDRSLIGNDLRVHGTIVTSPVAQGAELLGYSNFGAGNYMLNESSYNFGSSPALCIISWFKTSDAGQYQYMASVFDDTGTDTVAGMALMTGTGNFYMYDTIALIQSTRSYIDGGWHCAVSIFDGYRRQGYVDGELIVNVIHTAAVDLSQVDRMAVGHYCHLDAQQYHWRGDLCLTRFSKTLPSPEQIRAIYEEEKPLFLENAKATLYGSSDDIKALSYDHSTRLLHAGTNQGRSTFSGLKRIENTVAPVNVDISSSNGLIAEG